VFSFEPGGAKLQPGATTADADDQVCAQLRGVAARVTESTESTER
jgi:hypothetical protein